MVGGASRWWSARTVATDSTPPAPPRRWPVMDFVLSAAGAAGLVKAALAVHHGVVPPQPAEMRVNGELGLDAAGLRLTTEQQPWPHDDVRRAGVSSFGFGGTNVHAVLEGAPAAGPVRRDAGPAAQTAARGAAQSDARPAEGHEDAPWLFLLSAGSVPDLARHAEEIRGFVAGTPDATPAAVARTLASRELLTARLAVVAATREELRDKLDVAARRLAEGALGELAEGIHATAAPLPAEDRKVAFAFPGQGSQRPGMLADLVRRFPALAERAAELAEFTAEESATLPQALPDLLWGGHEPDDAEAQAALTVTDVCQPGLGITGVSTMELLAACGVEPDIAVGHSVGEFPAAVATVQSRLGAQPAAMTAQRAAAPTPEPVQQAPAAAGPSRPVADRSETADVRAFPEVLASLERARTIASASVHNPYFLQHEGTIRDTTRVGDHELISFSSYNYLGLSGHPAVSAAIADAVERYGSSVSAARILSGNRPLHEELDRGLAELVGAQAAVTLVSGHATNVTVIGHLMGAEDLILHDSLAHDSIIQGCRQSGAARQPFPHNDIAALDRILSQVRDRYRRVLIVVEGVYSMDGGTADLPALIAVKEKHGALLMVDEAHSIGVMGKTGGGMAEFSGVTPEDVDVWMGTLSKSLASCGGYVAGRHELIEHFRYTLPGFVFSAGLPPASTAAALAALRLIREEPERVTRLHDNSELFLRLAAEAGIDVGTSEGTPIVPAITGDSMKALQLSDRLYARGVSANPILHPAVEERLARLRFFITSEHTEEQITASVDILAEELAKLS
ncbi:MULTISPECIES: aminotransferase class I/II-fold pyridoxal phosphate-dependent enzyme [Streptomyces]|uniref:aminotransferase class I/II-fold pyridoxal phosphate-dependent enzyme n=1 Tax=Streptomyces TaxID=1883 RepID=UPI00359F55CD